VGKREQEINFCGLPDYFQAVENHCEQRGFNLFPMIFAVGIAIAKGALANHSHAQLHTMHRSRVSGGD
jgi:hypothetical protein